MNETAQQAASWSLLIAKYYPGDQMNKNEMGRACSMYFGQQRCIQGFGKETMGMASLGMPWRRCQNYTKMYLEEVDWEAWIGLIWLRIGTSGGLL